jgi:hypothetical protein
MHPDQKVKQPKDYLDDNLLNTFGWREFEVAIKEILVYLADDSKSLPSGPSWPLYGEQMKGWTKLFRIDTFPGIDPTMFALLCSCGWIAPEWFPKYTFKLSERAIERLAQPRENLVFSLKA